MTDATRDQIKKFAATRDMSLVPQIFIGISEEDNVGSKLKYKSCLRLLRNIAAHEPATFTAQIQAGNNVNSFKLAFITQKDSKVVFDLAQFTAWMFDAYRIFDNVGYLAFWKAFVLAVLPMWDSKNEYSFTFKSGVNPLFNYVNWMNEAVKHGAARVVNPDDDFVNNLYADNPKLFWRYAIPDMSAFLRLFVNGTFSVKDKANVLAYLDFFELREGSSVCEQREKCL